MRNHLHALAGRRTDRLSFEAQEAVAERLQFFPESGDEDARRAEGAERFMQTYYRHARVVTRAAPRIFERLRPPKKRSAPTETDLGNGVRLFDGFVSIAGTAELTADPALAMRVYDACLRHAAPVLPFARDAIARAVQDAAFAQSLRETQEAASIFVNLVCTVREAKVRGGSMMGELHDVGLLLAMIPEFSPVIGRVHHDVYHVYTVDVHSVAAVDRLRCDRAR